MKKPRVSIRVDVDIIVILQNLTRRGRNTTAIFDYSLSIKFFVDNFTGTAIIKKVTKLLMILILYKISCKNEEN